MSKYEKLMQDTIAEMVNLALEDMRGFSRKSKEQKREIANLDNKLDETFSKLTILDKKVIEDYICEVLTDNDNMYDEIYLQGYKDSIKLLKFIGVI